MNSNFFEFMHEKIAGIALAGQVESREVDLDRLKVLDEVAKQLSLAFDDDAEVKVAMHPAILSGSVSVEVPEVSLNEERVMCLYKALAYCNTISFNPLVDGTISVSLSVNGVFK